MSVRRAELTFRTWGVLSNTDRVSILASTGLGWFARGVFAISLLHGVHFLVQHGACRLARVKPVLHESILDLHGSCNFSSSEVGNLIFFSVFRVYYDLRILIGLIKDPINEIG